MFAKVLLLSPPFSELTYSLPPYFPENFWKVGLRVLVPLGSKKKSSLRSAVISALQETSGLPAKIKIKDIFFPLEVSPLLSPDLIALSQCLGERHAYQPGSVYGHVLPANLRADDARLRWRQTEMHRDLNLRSLYSASPYELSQVAHDLLQQKAYFISHTQDEAEREICSLKIDPPWPVRPAAKRQVAILDYLHENGSQSRRKLLNHLGSEAQHPLQKLLALGYVSLKLDDEDTISDLVIPPGPSNLILNSEQKMAFTQLSAALDSDHAECRLLYGVTGSGKTAIYMELIRKCLAKGQSVFLLAPEVALAHKLHRDAQSALSQAPIYLYHGYQSAAKREKIFKELSALKQACLLVGTRSALFLPVPRLCAVILDEEHDSSFKQDETFAYHAKEVAWFRVADNRGLMLLGSATPDLRTYLASSEEKLPQVKLSKRVSGRGLPPMRLVEIGPKAGMSSAGAINATSDKILADECEQELVSCMERGEQAVILLNRRGYAPLIFCVDCNHTLRCPNCEIGLAYHKNIGKLLCHYCGYSLPYPAPCPDCGKTNFLPVGEGTEKLEERLESIAKQPILRLDRDNVRRPGKMDEILEDFARQKTPFLVGTQMLSKGHHFPNVTLVLVADGDIGLNMPDYRAAEKSFQLLVQAAGRAGRGIKPGKVLVQTRNKRHYCWDFILNYDYEGFAQAELAKRKKHLYPPYINLAMLRISYPADSTKGAEALAALSKDLSTRARSTDIRMLGPAPAPIAMLRGQKRFQCLFKCKEWKFVRDMYFYAQKHPASRHLQLFLDLDPVNMM